MSLTISELRKQMRPHLSKTFFKPQPSRVVFLVGAYLVALLHGYLTYKLILGELPLAVWALSLIITANCETAFFFVMHEVLHGAIVKSKAAIYIVAFLGGIPFLCSPYLWRKWHSVHHRHTAEQKDPDREFHPTLDGKFSFFGYVNHLAKKFRYVRLQSYIVPFFVISGHHLLVLIQALVGRGRVKLNLWRAVVETLIVYSLFFTPLILLDLRLSLLGFYLPILLAHAICNVYIITNHFDNPLNKTNYPLVNSTSVYFSSAFPWTHMGFGRHVEHHIYPHITHGKLEEVTILLRKMYPEEFQERSFFTVLHSIFSRPNAFGSVHGEHDA